MFFADFLSYFMSPGEESARSTWMHKLPDLSSNSTNVALDLSVQVTASAFCAIEAANPAVLREAYGLYGKTLAAHSTLLMLERPSVDMICTSAMLSLFETMQCTTTDTYREHIRLKYILNLCLARPSKR